MLAATLQTGYLLTTSPSTTADSSGSISGNQLDAIALQYIGSNTFIILNYAGSLTVQ
jgi:hypothetical protein